MTRHPLPVPRRHRGFSLIEALIALLVLCLGMLTVARLQPMLRLQAELARQRSEATRLAQQHIEQLRAAHTVLAPADDMIEADSGTRYRLTRRVNADALTVTLAWTARDGAAQQVALDTVIARTDPLLSAASTLAPHRADIRGAFGRAPQVPLTARDLGDGTSLLPPAADGIESLRLDNRSGDVVARCAGDLSTCTRIDGMLLSGEVHFGAATPLPLRVNLTLEGGPPLIAPWCRSEVRQRFIAYHCVVVPPVGPRQWSGRTTLEPEGWNIGNSPADWRICRVTPDLDRSGAIDHNLEHPAIYQNVSGALTHQNFFVTRGNEPCPAGMADDAPTSP